MEMIIITIQNHWSFIFHKLYDIKNRDNNIVTLRSEGEKVAFLEFELTDAKYLPATKL